MLTGELRNKVDRIWDAFWSGGIANPIEVIDQITYLLFIRRLDELQTLEENKANATGKPIARRVFPEGKYSPDERIMAKRPYADLRWSRFRHIAPADMFAVVNSYVFPFLRTLGADGSTYSHHMKDARFTLPTPALLAKVVEMLDDISMTDRGTKGDLYEYMLGKIATAGQNGQFRTPRHIIQLMVELVAPTPADTICDPAYGKLIVDHLVEHGMVEPGRLYESPFTDLSPLGPKASFDPAQLNELIAAVNGVNKIVVAA